MFGQAPQKREDSISLAGYDYVRSNGLFKLQFANISVSDNKKGTMISAKCLAKDPKTNQPLGKVRIHWDYDSSDQEDLSFFLNIRDDKGNLAQPPIVAGQYGQTLQGLVGKEVFALVKYSGEGNYNGYSFSNYKLIAFTDNRGYDAFSVNNKAQTPQKHCQKFLSDILNPQNVVPVQQQQQMQQQQMPADFRGAVNQMIGGFIGGQGAQQSRPQAQPQQNNFANGNDQLPF